MGIDQEIQRRMDAYRGNPQALQQRYQMSQQLLDLLALQKLKSEKDAVARQMQAQMQQMPGTVAQQLEQEMVGRTKQDLAQQTAGILQQKQQQQQKAMQQMAQQMAQRSMPQGGIAGLAPQGARPAPRMAGGGIVPTKSSERLISPKETINTIFSLLREGKFNDREAVIQAALELGKAESQEELTDLRRAIFMNYAVTSGNYPTQARILPKDLSDKLLNFELGDSAFKTFGMPYDDRKPQTAQPAPRMAGGGIVAFQEGDLVKNPEDYPQIEALRQRRAALEQELANIGPYSRVGVVPPGSEEKYARIDALEKEISSIDRLLDRGRTYRTGLTLPGTARTEQLQDLESALAGAAAAEGGPAPVRFPRKVPDLNTLGVLAPEPEPGAPEPEAGAPAARRDMGGAGVLQQGGPEADMLTRTQGAETAAPQIDTTGLLDRSEMPNRNEIVQGLASLRAQTPEAAREATMQAYSAATKRDEVGKMYEGLLGRLQALDKRQMDPEKLRQEEFRAFLRGAAGKSTFGLAGAGGGAAAANVRRQQEMAEEQRLMRELGLTKEAMLADSEMGAKGFQEGMRAFEQAASDRRKAIEATITLSDSDRRAYDEQAQRKLDARIAQGKLNSEALTRDLERSMELLKYYSDERQRGVENRLELQQVASGQLQAIKGIEQEIRNGVRAELAMDMQRARNALSADPEDEAAKQMLEALEIEAERRIAAEMSGIGDALGMPGVDLNALRDQWMRVSAQAFPQAQRRRPAITPDEFAAITQFGD